MFGHFTTLCMRGLNILRSQTPSYSIVLSQKFQEFKAVALTPGYKSSIVNEGLDLFFFLQEDLTKSIKSTKTYKKHKKHKNYNKHKKPKNYKKHKNLQKT